MNTGDTISRYRILGPLGKGGMGVVYHAEDTRLHRPLALKFLPPDSLGDLDRQRFLNEARAAAAVRHPNICAVYDIEEADGRVFIAMAYLEGETLARRIARGPLPVSEALGIGAQIAAGLQAAHDAGIVHRDIKAGNIHLAPNGHVSVMDFGLALQSGDTRLTAIGSTVGTPAYMSPEQACGRPVDGRADIWSLGVVLFEMLAGRLPFHRDHSAAIFHAIVSDPVPDLTSIRSGVPPEAQRLIERALAKKPEERWASAREIGAALRRIEGEFHSLPTQTMEVEVPPRRSRAVPIAVACAALLASSLGIYRFTRHQPPAPAHSGARLPDETQIAILPFELADAGESTHTVADGLVSVLTAALSDFQRFQGRITAVSADKIRTPEEARKQYGANLVITGRAQPVAGKVQFTLNLIDTATLRQNATRVFTWDPADPIASRDQAVDQVVRLLNSDITPQERTALRAGDTSAPAAYAAYLEGRGLLARFDSREDVSRAILAFQRAIAADPGYALAYAGLGEAYWREAEASGDRQYSELAVQNAQRGVDLNGSLPQVHSALGEALASAGRQEEAVREFRSAIELAPGNAEAPRQLAKIYANLGRDADAEKLYLQSTKSRPTDWYGFFLLGLFYAQRERFQEGEAAYHRARQLAPENNLPVRNLGALYLRAGRYRDAVTSLQQALEIRPSASTWGSLTMAFYYLHQFDEAVSAGEAANDMDSAIWWIWGNLGMCYQHTAAGNVKAEPALRRALELGAKQLEATPSNYDTRADLAEYHARLGERKAALAEIERIPPEARKPRAARIALVMELTGHRDKAIGAVAANITTASALNQIRDDPDLEGLWKDPRLQAAIRRAR